MLHFKINRDTVLNTTV